MKINKRYLFFSLWMLTAFLCWTAAAMLFDVQPVGPRGSYVGFAAVNQFVHRQTGVHMFWYEITDYLSIVPLGIAAGFALTGLKQLICRKHLAKVDRSILILGGFYMVVLAVYVLFELLVVNYRPVLIDNILEPSYPSSTTVLVLCVMLTAGLQFDARVQNQTFKRWIGRAITVFNIFMVGGRLFSGVHWFSDIIGGVLLSIGLVWLYRAFVETT